MTITIDRFPDEVYLRIFGYLDQADLRRITAVCQNWNRLANDNSLWKPIFRRSFNLTFKEEPRSFKIHYYEVIKAYPFHFKLIEALGGAKKFSSYPYTNLGFKPFHELKPSDVNNPIILGIRFFSDVGYRFICLRHSNKEKLTVLCQNGLSLTRWSLIGDKIENALAYSTGTPIRVITFELDVINKNENVSLCTASALILQALKQLTTT